VLNIHKYKYRQHRARFGALYSSRTSPQRKWGAYLRLAAALCEMKRATLSRTQPSPHSGSCPSASAPVSGSITRPRAFFEGPSCPVNQLSSPRFSLPHTAHRSVPDCFGSSVVAIRRASALTPRKLPPEEPKLHGSYKKANPRCCAHQRPCDEASLRSLQYRVKPRDSMLAEALR
jgi:hypothetical protein